MFVEEFDAYFSLGSIGIEAKEFARDFDWFCRQRAGSVKAYISIHTQPGQSDCAKVSRSIGRIRPMQRGPTLVI